MKLLGPYVNAETLYLRRYTLADLAYWRALCNTLKHIGNSTYHLMYNQSAHTQCICVIRNIVTILVNRKFDVILTVHRR